MSKFKVGDVVRYSEGPDKTHYRVTGLYDLFGGTAVTLSGLGAEHVEFEDKLEIVSSTFRGSECESKKPAPVISQVIKNWLSTLPAKD